MGLHSFTHQKVLHTSILTLTSSSAKAINLYQKVHFTGGKLYLLSLKWHLGNLWSSYGGCAITVTVHVQDNFWRILRTQKYLGTLKYMKLAKSAKIILYGKYLNDKKVYSGIK